MFVGVERMVVDMLVVTLKVTLLDRLSVGIVVVMALIRHIFVVMDTFAIMVVCLVVAKPMVR
jgi:hypothetical protein